MQYDENYVRENFKEKFSQEEIDRALQMPKVKKMISLVNNPWLRFSVNALFIILYTLDKIFWNGEFGDYLLLGFFSGILVETLPENALKKVNRILLIALSFALIILYTKFGWIACGAIGFAINPLLRADLRTLFKRKGDKIKNRA